jgi:hypothetical protein
MDSFPSGKCENCRNQHALVWFAPGPDEREIATCLACFDKLMTKQQLASIEQALDGLFAEYGNEMACDNCGNEWSEFFTQDGRTNLCQDCHDEYEASN